MSDGTTLWFVDDTPNKATAYTVSTRARDTSKDVSLGSGIWTGGVTDGTTLWFINLTDKKAVAYIASTLARDSGSDISLGDGDWYGGPYTYGTLWFVDNKANKVATYTASTRARDASKDIDLGTGLWTGGMSDGTTMWFVNAISVLNGEAVAYDYLHDTTGLIEVSGLNLNDQFTINVGDGGKAGYQGEAGLPGSVSIVPLY